MIAIAPPRKQSHLTSSPLLREEQLNTISKKRPAPFDARAMNTPVTPVMTKDNLFSRPRAFTADAADLLIDVTPSKSCQLFQGSHGSAGNRTFLRQLNQCKRSYLQALDEGEEHEQLRIICSLVAAVHRKGGKIRVVSEGGVISDLGNGLDAVSTVSQLVKTEATRADPQTEQPESTPGERKVTFHPSTKHEPIRPRTVRPRRVSDTTPNDRPAKRSRTFTYAPAEEPSSPTTATTTTAAATGSPLGMSRVLELAIDSEDLTGNDILCGGSGIGILQVPNTANRIVHGLVQIERDHFRSVNKGEKTKIVQNLINNVTNSGCRFVMHDKSTNLWYPIKDGKVFSKVVRTFMSSESTEAA